MFSWRRSAEGGSSNEGAHGDEWDRRARSFGQVLDEARKGEVEEISMLYRQFLPAIFGYIAARVAERTMAEDLTSEVFLKMVEGIRKVRASDEAGFAAWLFQIARTTVAEYYRERKKQPAFIGFEAMDWENDLNVRVSDTTLVGRPDADPVRLLEAREDWRIVVQAINTLTEEQRQVLIGRLILGYDVATVARMVGKQANAVKALQFRALQSLKRLLKKDVLPEMMAHARHQEDAR